MAEDSYPSGSSGVSLKEDSQDLIVASENAQIWEKGKVRGVCSTKKEGAEVAAPKENSMKKSFSPEYIDRVESQLHTTWVLRAPHVFESCGAADTRC